MQLDFYRDGLLETSGLPVCPRAQIDHADTGRRAGSAPRDHRHRPRRRHLRLRGHRGRSQGQGVALQRAAESGNPTVIGHAYSTIPFPRTYTVVIPIKRLKNGPYAYRATIEVPKLAAGGMLTHIDGRIGRRYDFNGSERSYVNARCSIGVIRTHGHFLFSDGTIMDGTLEKPCTPVPLAECPSCSS